MSVSTRSFLRVDEEVADALAEQRPVVALESTLLTHGLPADRADVVARALEDDVRLEGAVPATLAILDHRFVVGLSVDDRARLLEGSARKASLRDLAVATVQGGLWSTTVAATMVIAHQAGIRLFATGGIGGVHRHADRSFDESADLVALSRIPVAVVSAGIKVVLDIPRTMERLETLGVPVVGYRCQELPGFYYASSGVMLQAHTESPNEVAALVGAQLDGMGAGLLVVQPPPRTLDPRIVDGLIEEAVRVADREGVRGGDVTPRLLDALRVGSGGESVEVNVELVRANARLAARVAVIDRDICRMDPSST